MTNIANWKDPPCYQWVNPRTFNGHVQRVTPSFVGSKRNDQESRHIPKPEIAQHHNGAGSIHLSHVKGLGFGVFRMMIPWKPLQTNPVESTFDF